VITRDALAYTLRILGLKYDADVFERIMEKYVHLDLYPDARQTLVDLKQYKLAILSNGSSEMLNTLVRNTRPGRHPRRDDQHRRQTDIQAEPGSLLAHRGAPRRKARRGHVCLLQSLGCARRKVGGFERGVDRAGVA